jgi:hypothetical protein
MKWTKEKVIDMILEFNNEHIPLNIKFIIDNYVNLYGAAIRYCGSWKNAIELAKLDYNKIKQKPKGRNLKWTRGKIIDEVLQLKNNNINLSAVNIQTNYSGLYKSVYRNFGGWNKFLEEINIDVNQYCKRKIWNDHETIKVLKELKGKYGKVNGTIIYKNVRG